MWFKDDMAKAILNGRKTSTTRDHRREPGVYQAVIGSRYRALPFASIRITQVKETTWAKVFEENWREEGFNSPGHMRDWCQANGLAKDAGTVYLHRFIVCGVLPNIGIQGVRDPAKRAEMPLGLSQAILEAVA